MNAIVQAPRFTYDMPLAEMINACKFHQVNAFFTEENFPAEGVGEVKMPSVHRFNRWIDTKGALEEFDKLGLRPASLREMLLLLSSPDAPQSNPVIALDIERAFRRDGGEWVPVLWLQVGSWEGIEGNVLRILNFQDVSSSEPSRHGSAWLFAVVQK